MPPIKLKKAPEANGAKAPRKRKGGVKYPELEVEKRRGEEAIPVEESQDLLGWTVVGKDDEYHVEDVEGNYVFCKNITRNRPLYPSKVAELKQSLLRNRWYFNGESIIVDRLGGVQNGQHTLIAHVLAEQERVGPQAHYWASYHKGPILLEKVLVKGISEEDKVVNTIDTAKGRSLSDVIYRGDYFRDLPPTERRVAARAADHCVRLLWQRTGVDVMGGAFSPRKTFTESLDFIDRHPRIVKAVIHIIQEDKEKKVVSEDGSEEGNGISKPISAYYGKGYAAALLYLMGCSASDGDAYRNEDPPNEKVLDWSNWTRACEFWVAFATHSAELAELRDYISQLTNDGRPLVEKTSAIIQAWEAFLSEKRVTKATVRLKYLKDEKGADVLVKPIPELQGIDLGEPEREEEEDEMEARVVATPTPTRKGKKAPVVEEEAVEEVVEDEDATHYEIPEEYVEAVEEVEVEEAPAPVTKKPRRSKVTE